MKLNIFIDGSWLFKVQNGVLKSKRIRSQGAKPVFIDFSKLSNLILKHVQANGFPYCKEFGERHCCISVLTLPGNLDTWEGKKISELNRHLKNNNYVVNKSDLDKVKKNCFVRDNFARSAVSAGFEANSIIRPELKPWMIENLSKGRFQEKQVDTTVVALLVKSAITKQGDVHAIIAGDADILPAIKIAYPEFSENILIATTHPDELKAEHRQTSFTYQEEEFNIPALYLQDYVKEIINGEVIECSNCHYLFEPKRLMNPKKRVYCPDCESTRE